MSDEERIDVIYTALSRAMRLADVATDWNLDEVEIGGKMVNTYDLYNELRIALAVCDQLKHSCLN